MKSFLSLSVLALACGPAFAQTIDFQALEHNDNLIADHGTVVSEDGFDVTKGQGEPFNFASFGTQVDRYPGSTALFNNTVSGLIKISAADGHSFDVSSIDFACLNSPGSVTINLVGNKTGGGQVFQTINHSDPDGILPLDLVTYPLSGFTGLDSIEWTQDSPFHQFDNVVIGGGGGGPSISSYDIRDAARSGFGGWAHTYGGTIVDTGSFSANGFAFTRANYSNGSGTLNDGAEGTGPADTQLFANNGDARPRITLHLDGTYNVSSLLLANWDSGNSIPGTLRGCDVTINGQTESFTTTEPSLRDELVDLSGSPLSRLCTDTVILSNFIHDGSNGLNEMFCIGEISVRGQACSGGIDLSVRGTCPGSVTVSWSGAAPNSTVALIFAKNTGSFVIPFGPCQGTVLGLGSNQIRLVNTFPAGSNGSGSRSGQAGRASCRGYLQMHDIPNCTLSNVAQLP